MQKDSIGVLHGKKHNVVVIANYPWYICATFDHKEF